MQIQFRNHNNEDKNFILSSWINSLKQKKSKDITINANGKSTTIEQGFMTAFMPHDLYFERVRPLIENKIFPISTTIVAYNPEFEDQIYGYIAFRKFKNSSIISFCYVKHNFRKMGIAKQLFEIAKSETNVATYHAPWLNKLYKNNGILFDPFFDLEL